MNAECILGDNLAYVCLHACISENTDGSDKIHHILLLPRFFFLATIHMCE